MKKILISMLSLFMIVIPSSNIGITTKQVKSEVTCNAYDAMSDLRKMNKEDLNEVRLEKAKEVAILKAKEEELKAKKAAELAEAAKNNANQVNVIATQTQVAYTPQNDEEKEVFNLSSKSKYLVYVNVSQQMVYIFAGNQGNWRLKYNFQCSSGVGSYPDGNGTPTGQYTISSRGTWFFADKYQEGAEYWVQFYGNYLFHSLPMDKNHNVVDTTLGKPASHGCVRLAIDNAKWIYNNVPNGTKVYIK